MAGHQEVPQNNRSQHDEDVTLPVFHSRESGPKGSAPGQSLFQYVPSLPRRILSMRKADWDELEKRLWKFAPGDRLLKEFLLDYSRIKDKECQNLLPELCSYSVFQRDLGEASTFYLFPTGRGAAFSACLNDLRFKLNLGFGVSSEVHYLRFWYGF